VKLLRGIRHEWTTVVYGPWHMHRHNSVTSRRVAFCGVTFHPARSEQADDQPGLEGRRCAACVRQHRKIMASR
jgi:hypothetical protein